MAGRWIALWALALGAALLSGIAGCGDRDLDGPKAASAPAPERTGALEWISVTDRDELRARLASAQRTRRPAVVAVWAPWCVYCQRYDRLMTTSPALRRRLGRCELLRIDVEKDDRTDLRFDVGIPPETQPFMVFVDARGRVRHDLDVDRWQDDAETSLDERLQKLEGG